MGRFDEYHYYWGQLGKQSLGIRVAHTKGMAIMGFAVNYELTEEEELTVQAFRVTPVTALKLEAGLYQYWMTHQDLKAAYEEATYARKRPLQILWFNREKAGVRPERGQAIHPSLLRKTRGAEFTIGRKPGMSMGGDSLADPMRIFTHVADGKSLRVIAYLENTSVSYIRDLLVGKRTPPLV